MVLLQVCFVQNSIAIDVSFQGLGDLPGGRFYCIAEAVSADGSVVIGASESAGGNEAFRWTSSGGLQGLGDLPGGGFNSWAKGISGDGSMVVGFSDSGSDSYKQEAFKWTQSGGMQGIGFLPGATNSIAYGISGDGSVIVGRSNFQAYRYLTASSSIQSIGMTSSYVNISPDGSIVVGDVWSGHEAFRWSQSDGLERLGYLSVDDAWSLAHAASSDGSVIGGESGAPPLSMEAFKWTRAGGMIGLGDLPGGKFFSIANAVSGDGSVIVGESDTGLGGGLNEAFIWDGLNGMRNLKLVLENDFGLDLTGWTLYSAMGISADGLTIVGHGRNPYGYQEGWIATIPEPTTLLLLGLGGILLRKRQR